MACLKFYFYGLWEIYSHFRTEIRDFTKVLVHYADIVRIIGMTREELGDV